MESIPRSLLVSGDRGKGGFAKGDGEGDNLRERRHTECNKNYLQK